MGDASQDRHTYDVDVLDRHVKVRASDGGSCLNRHVSAVVANNSCSHRWQAQLRAETDDKALYVLPATHPFLRHSSRGAYMYFGRGEEGDMMARFRQRPKAGQWDPGAINWQNGKVNFSDSSFYPYHHNAHHLVPNGVIAEGIDKASGDDGDVYDMIRIQILEDKYNLNFKDNMMILPMDMTVAAALRIPRHLSGADVVGGAGRPRSHPKYSAFVQKKVNKSIADFVSEIDKSDSDHVEMEFSGDIKESLEAISELMRGLLIAYGKSSPGDHINYENDLTPITI